MDDEQRQTGPHPHAILLDPADRFALVPDLGSDRILIYRFEAAAGTLRPHAPAFVSAPPGSGPRHLRFHPNGRFVYVNTEIGNTVIAYAYDAERGTLTEVQVVSTLPTAAQCRAAGVACQASLERYMKCGIGVCGQCDCDGRRVCVEGPTFSIEELEEMPSFGRTRRDKTGRRITVTAADECRPGL